MTQPSHISLDPTGAEPRARSDDRPRFAAIVLGMHRSGTSAVARVLSLLGADLPRNLMPVREDNPTGHWEPLAVVDLDDELLDAAASTWDDVSPFPLSWYGSAPEAGFRERAIRSLREEYGDSPLFVLKDPRMCRLVRFWVSALDEYGATPCFVITVRNPLEVAASLRARNEFSLSKGLLLWLRHMLDAERDTRGHPRVFVSYTGLLDDWESQARTISEHLQISWPSLSDAARDEVESFLNVRQRDQQFTAADLERHAAAVSWVKRCYAALERACETGDTPDPEVLNEIAEQVRQADRAYGPLLATTRRIASRRADEIHSLTAAGAELEAELEQRTSSVAQLATEVEALHDAREEADRLGAELEELTSSEQQLAIELEALSGAREQADRLGGELEQLRSRERRLAAELETMRGAREEAARVGAELQQLRGRDRQLAAELEALSGAREEADRLGVALEQLRSRERQLAAKLEALSGAREEADRLGIALEQRTASEQRLATELETLRSAREDADRLGAELAARRLRAAIAQRELTRREQELESRRAEIVRLDRELEAGSARTARSQVELDRLAAELAASQARAEGLDTELERSRDELRSQRAAATKAETELGATQSDLESVRGELAKRDQRIAELERERASTGGEHDRLAAAAAAREAELEAGREQLAGAERELTQLRAQVAESEGRLGQQRSESGRLARELELRATRETELRADLGAQAAEAAALAARVDALDNALEGFASGLERLRATAAADRDQTALTYLEAKPPGRLRTGATLLGWTLWPGTFAKARSFRAIRRSGRFDETFYLLSYPDAAASGRHPIAHYVERGAAEGKDPNRHFSTSDYLALHPEVDEAGEIPFAHFLRQLGGNADG